MSLQSHEKNLTVLTTVSGILNAQVLQAKLEKAGIPAILDYESASLIFGITATGLKLSQVRILVAEKDAQDALCIVNTPPPPGWEEEALASSSDDSSDMSQLD
jgi:hypothetical protein